MSIRVRPFRALRPVPHKAAQVASLPYDVVDRDEASALAQGNRNSFLHVVRSEIDLPPTTSPYDDAVYTKARANLDGLLAEGVLMVEDTPQMYLYRQVLNHQGQVGLVCCCHLDDYADNKIRKHEKTRPDKEDDRTRHTLALNANAGPVFLTYRDDPAIEDLMANDMNDRPLFHFNAPDGVTHTVWPVQNPDAYTRAFGAIPTAYVADGHHRSASAARAAAQRRSENPNHQGDEEYNWFLSVLFPAESLTILPYNRIIKDLNGLDPAAFLTRLGEVGTLQTTDTVEPQSSGTFCFYLDGTWHQLSLDPGSIDSTDPIASLDVDLLTKRVLEPILGIEDQRTSSRIEFVGGVRGPEELQRRVDQGQAALGISMFPTSIQQLLSVADAGLIMPPKSTWFEPKLRSGLFVHSLASC